jgi:hypothetical protein
MKRALIADLHAVAKQRGDGYLEACVKFGRISRDGQWMIFDDATHSKIRLQYNPHRTISLPLPGGQGGRIGVGDAIHKIAGPIGKAIHWPCLKNDGTTHLKPDSPCARARRWLNKVQV